MANLSTPISACIVRSASQATAFNSAPKAETIFLCTNHTTYEFCTQNSFRALLLDEEMIRGEYGPVNSWALKQAFAMVQKFRGDQKNLVFFDTNLMYLEAIFTQGLKILFVLKKVLSEHKFSNIYSYDDENAFLPTLWTEYLKKNASEKKIIFISQAKSKKPLKTAFGEVFYKFLGGVVSRSGLTAARRAAKSGKKITLVSGALNHLGAVLEKLRSDNSLQAVYCENTFNFSKWKFCRSRQIPFLVIPENEYKPIMQGRYFWPNELVYQGTDYGDFFNKAFGILVKKGKLPFGYHYETVLSFFEKMDVAFTLLDEDMTRRRIFLALSKIHSKPCYVVSHGVPGIYLDEKESGNLRGKYECGTTFVQSEFEKEVYAGIYYPESRFIVSGLPRYDEIHRLKRVAPVSKGIKNVLYCGSMMRSLEFDELWPWMGSKTFFREYTQRYTRDVLEALSGFSGIQLKIKPHYHEESLWEEFLRINNPGKVSYEVLSHQANIFELEAESDLIITPESSVICEGLMLEKPVIVLNYAHPSLIAPFDRYPVIEHARSKEELVRAVRQSLEDSAYQKKLADERRKYFDYYAGAFDGGATERVCGYLKRQEIL